MLFLYKTPTNTAIGQFLDESIPCLDAARMSVPFGVPFLIVEESDIPIDWATSAAWIVDYRKPDGIGIGPQRWHIARIGENITAAETELAPADADEAAAFEARREGFIAGSLAMIANLKAEVFAAEGVQL